MVAQSLFSLTKSQRELLAIISGTDLITEKMLETPEFSANGASDLAAIMSTNLISISKEINGFRIAVPEDLKAHFYLEFMQLPPQRRSVVGKMIAQNHFDRDQFLFGLQVLANCGDKRTFTDAMLSKVVEIRSNSAADIVISLASQMIKETFIEKLAAESYRIVALIWKEEYVNALSAIDRFESEHLKELQEKKLHLTFKLLRANANLYMGRPKTGTKEILDLVEDLQDGNPLISPSAALIACRTLASAALLTENYRWSSDALRIASKFRKFSDSEYSKYVFTIIESVALFIEGNLNHAYEKAISAIYIANSSGFSKHQSPLEALYVAASCEEEFMQTEKALVNWGNLIKISEETLLPSWLAIGKIREARTISTLKSNHDVMTVVLNMRVMGNELPYKNELDMILDAEELLVSYRMQNFERLKILAERIESFPRVQIILDAVNVHTNGKKLPNILISGTPREEVMDLLVRANLPNTSAIQLQKILEKVLAISEKYGFRRVILVQRTHILTMVLKIASSGKSAYLEHLIRTVRSITEAGVVGSPAERIALTNKEKEVLNLLVAGFDRKEICENLAITLNTLKTHQKKLYEKLGVSSRDKAIDAAQKLGLIAG